MSYQSTAPSISVIVAEDEADLLEEVMTFLRARGMEVRGATNGTEFRRLFEERRPEVIVLDLNLADEDGIAITMDLRALTPALGIIMTTARGTIEDRISGYETGADIYLVKPVDLGELAAAIRAMRRHRMLEQDTKDAPAIEDRSDWILDLVAWQITAPGGATVQLTRLETLLLDCLTESPGTPVSRLKIGRRMGKSDALNDHRYVDQIIRRLRRKIEAQTGREAPIGAAHNQGYFFKTSITRLRAP